MSRVRQFLSTPHYVENQESYNSHLQPSPTKLGRVIKSQIPVYQYQQQISHQTHPNLLSPNARSNFNPNFSPNHGGGGDADRLHHHNQSNTTAHISFSDDLFINHSHQPSGLSPGIQGSTFPSSPKFIAGQQFPGATYQNQGKSVDISFSDVNQIHGKNGRKNFETFVMTGE